MSFICRRQYRGPGREALALLVLSVMAWLCVAPPVDADERSPLGFTSPEEAVTIVTDLLRREDWPTLARYYDLTGSSLSYDDLASGRLFVRTSRPESAHPGLPWRFRHPFTPGFTFRSARAGGRPDVVVVVVGIDIDQGGGRVQRGQSEFELGRGANGYRLLPPAGELD